MDPNWWPLHDFWPLGIASVRMRTTTIESPSPPPPPKEPALWIKWGPTIVVGIMVPFVGWLWHDREAVLARTTELQRAVDGHEGQLAVLSQYNRAQDQLRETEIKGLADRLDIHRRQIDSIQQQMLDHMNLDERRRRAQ